jgi:hypothetical protein
VSGGSTRGRRVRAGLTGRAACVGFALLSGALHGGCQPEVDCQATVVGGGLSHKAIHAERGDIDDVERTAIKKACRARCEATKVSDADKEWLGKCTTGCLADVDAERLSVTVECAGGEE